MKIKIQILSIYGGVLFEFEKENNTQRETILEAVNSRANLSGANLSRANLSGANLSGANLSVANLSGANLYGADLSRANLSRADLSGADLYGANLSRANLYGADLSGANLSGADLYGANLSGANLYGADLLDTFIQPHCTWVVGIKNDLIKIGCKEKSIEDWDIWFSGTEEYSTKRGTKDFAKIQAMYISLKAYTNFLKDFNEITK